MRTAAPGTSNVGRVLAIVTVALCAIGLSCAGIASQIPAVDVNVVHAGSLITVMERTIVPALHERGVEVHAEGKGSVALSNMIRDGLRTPDVFVSADPAAIEVLFAAPSAHVTWYATFGSMRMVLAYSPRSKFASEFAAVATGRRKLVDVLQTPGLRIGRTDPALDPKGYRAIITMQLLEREVNVPGLAVRVLGEARNTAQTLPDETILLRLEQGELDCGFLYSTESVARQFPALEFPPNANLGDSRRAAHYATQSVTIEGVQRVGAPATYALTIPSRVTNRAGAIRFTQFFLGMKGRELLERSGLTLAPIVAHGDRDAVPQELRALIR